MNEVISQAPFCLPCGKLQAGRPRSGGLACISGSQAFRDRGHLVCVPSESQAERLHHRIAGVSPACGCTQPLMSEVKISTAFWFAYRQSAGGTPAIRWSRLHFRIACVLPAFQDRRHLAWGHSDSQAKRLRSFYACVPFQFFVTKNIYPKI
ncbi:MAG: hypothetical protein LBP59_00790 [Planctomycetaceae bacterium]|jgi:hypothetical protein|nr:hypothetical protein [Planctomycetaceae bacterium]